MQVVEIKRNQNYSLKKYFKTDVFNLLDYKKDKKSIDEDIKEGFLRFFSHKEEEFTTEYEISKYLDFIRGGI